MKNHENPAKKPQPTTGIRATLRAFLRPDATRASKIRLLVTLTAITTFFAFTGTALAATPTVVSEFTSPTATPSVEANLEAAVNPGEEAAGITTECHFEYGTTSVTEHKEVCAQGNALEGGELGVSANVKGLNPGTTYHWRVVVKNTSGKAEGNPEEITTVPVPATEVPSLVGSTTATFKGKLTPLNATVGTQYFFYYNREEEAFCTNERGTNTEPETPLTGSALRASPRKSPNSKRTRSTRCVSPPRTRSEPKRI